MIAGVIADDLTGAHVMGALLAQAGLDCILVTSPEGIRDAEAVVIDTESRHLAAGSAYERVRLAASMLTDCSVFKKVDSTMRGPVTAELRALADSFPGETILFTPAYPAMGRTVRNGC